MLALAPARIARADADRVDAYRDAVARGSARFDDGDYAGARAEFQAAFAIHPDPVLIFNIASTYRREGDRPRAIELYRAFLDRADADDPRRDLARHTIAELQEEIEDERRAQREAREAEALAAARAQAEAQEAAKERTRRHGTGGGAGEGGGDGDGDGGGVASDPGVTDAPGAVAPDRAVTWLRWGGGGLVVLGVVASGLAVSAAGDVGDAERDLEALGAGASWGVAQQAAYDRGVAAERRAWLLAGAGVAALATGVALYVVGERRAERATPTVAILPGGDGAAVGWSGRW